MGILHRKVRWWTTGNTYPLPFSIEMTTGTASSLQNSCLKFSFFPAQVGRRASLMVPGSEVYQQEKGEKPDLAPGKSKIPLHVQWLMKLVNQLVSLYGNIQEIFQAPMQASEAVRDGSWIEPSWHSLISMLACYPILCPFLKSAQVPFWTGVGTTKLKAHAHMRWAETPGHREGLWGCANYLLFCRKMENGAQSMSGRVLLSAL